MDENYNYSVLSTSLTKQLEKKEKKDNGIFFTPPKTIKKNLEFLEPYIKDFKTVLEPSCGSCEFIEQLCKYDHLDITGIEINDTIFKTIEHIGNDKIKLYNENFLTSKINIKYDLIIGNPPYFVMKKGDVDKSYYNYFDGRPNIFILFIAKSLGMLNKNGILSFVLPRSFLNCLYYDKLRKHILENYQIYDIIDCDDSYIETKQDTIILILRNEKNINFDMNHEFNLNIQNYSIFGKKKDVKKMKILYKNSNTLSKMNFYVNVGNVVWNQCKSILTHDKSKTLLIYSSDISNNKLKIKAYSNKDKKNYIDKKGKTEPLLVINRGYGVGSYKFNYCIINENEDEEVKYLVENHLICIQYREKIEREELIKKYKKIIRSFNDERTKKFIKIYFGNNAMNTTELNNILPIYDI